MNADPHITTGAARPEELDTILRLLCDAFALPYDAAHGIFHSDPYFALENKRVLRVEGQVVSCLSLIERECWIGRAVVPLAGIAGVVTRPDERGKGYATRLLTDTLTTLRERGYPLCGLVPSDAGFYRRLGWENAAFSYRYLTAPQNLPAYPEARCVRPMRPEDLPRIENSYALYSHYKSLHCVRDAKRWRFIYDHVKLRAVADFGEGPEGYLLYETRAVPQMPAALRILEMEAGTVRARHALLGYLHVQQDVGCIEIEAPFLSLLKEGLLHPYAGSGASLASVDVTHSVMLRVVDFALLCQALCRKWQPLDFKVCLLCEDALFANERTAVLVESERETVTVRTATPAEMLCCPHRLTGSPGVWAQLAVGYMSGEEACLLGCVQATSPEAADIAGILFNQHNPFLPPVDHF